MISKSAKEYLRRKALQNSGVTDSRSKYRYQKKILLSQRLTEEGAMEAVPFQQPQVK